MSANNNYHFITNWEVQAPREEVYRTLEEVEGLPIWWPSVYLDLIVLEKGQPGGVGKLVELYTKGWLPYTLRWKFRVTKSEFPTGFALEAFGDLKGRGIWTFAQQENAPICRITYDWLVEAEKPLLRHFSFIFKPIFAANHHWAMRRGETSLKLELQRRNAKTEEAKKLIPLPPPPTFPHNLLNNKIFNNY